MEDFKSELINDLKTDIEKLEVMIDAEKDMDNRMYLIQLLEILKANLKSVRAKKG